jgi:hypothetical protein
MKVVVKKNSTLKTNLGHLAAVGATRSITMDFLDNHSERSGASSCNFSIRAAH